MCAAFGFVIGYWIGAGVDPQAPEALERHLLPNEFREVPDIPSVPEYRFVERRDTIVETRTDTLRVPVSFGDRYRVSDEQPITVQHSDVYFRYFDPDRQRHEVEQFDIPEPVWQRHFLVDVSYYYPDVYGVHGEAGVRYRRLELYGRAGGWFSDEVVPSVGGGMRVYF